MNKEKPEIDYTSKIENKIIEMRITKEVTKTGKGAHILLPKELIGKKCTVTFKEGGK